MKKKPKSDFYRPCKKNLQSSGDIFDCRAIFSKISAIFRKSRDIFKSRKYRDILLAIYRLAENIAIFPNIADISAILSTLEITLDTEERRKAVIVEDMVETRSKEGMAFDSLLKALNDLAKGQNEMLDEIKQQNWD